MNYRHAFHAGNFADVLKHAVLARILTHLLDKPGGFRVVDTHAGIGLYDLEGDEAGRTGEWQNGIGRVLDASPTPALADFLAPYLETVRRENPDGGLRHYPGSPAIVTSMLRKHDQLIANELHPVDADLLEEAMAGRRRAKVMRLDAYTAVKSLLPPPERRGLLLVDPPFEQPGEFDRMREAMRAAHQRFATGTQQIWYPIKDVKAVARFHDAVAGDGIERILRIEQWTRRPGLEGPLAGAGMLVVNPPWTLAEATRAVMPELTALLATGPGAGWRVDWLVPEASR
ncbi:Ribosomal RNA large subunit methyltransferase J [Hartmannibacter diazotrophicus]|uniref:Ribosomal RNA large subunit methyltransferase J n=1 Tax=Hartmannibacter diazotrophicus TaxID=1482074 RepID=A0A2C9D9M7_9HYPH|nr:23S rRNA (adenine(2030)-N(6))-methyltransferase RlmJ [Hartmannibacter diazotrophicus]SON57034.1 Ribosomal RNA large subunit methyltransferase J [Hartmannibacter diazotrophicus]